MKSRLILLPCLFAISPLCAVEPTSGSVASITTSSPSEWEWSLGAQLREFNVEWSAPSWSAYEASSWQGEDDEFAFGGALQLGKTLSSSDSTVVRFEMGYGFTRVDFHSGEITVGDTEDELYTLDISKLNLSVHQIHAGISFSKRLGSKVDIGFAFGPSLSIVSADFEATQEVFEHIRPNVGAYRDGRGVSESGTSALLGVFAEARARYNVSDEVFLEASAGYHWMDSKSYGGSGFGATLDPKSWAVGVKVGFKF